MDPLTNGDVPFSTLEGRPSVLNFEYNNALQNWVAATDIRISLDRLNTFGDEVFGDPKVLQSYYYSITDFNVGARQVLYFLASSLDQPVTRIFFVVTPVIRDTNCSLKCLLDT